MSKIYNLICKTSRMIELIIGLSGSNKQKGYLLFEPFSGLLRVIRGKLLKVMHGYQMNNV